MPSRLHPRVAIGLLIAFAVICLDGSYLSILAPGVLGSGDLVGLLLALPLPYAFAGLMTASMKRGGVRTAAVIAGASAGMAAYRVALIGVGGLDDSTCMWKLVPMVDFGIQALVVLFFVMLGPFLLTSPVARVVE